MNYKLHNKASNLMQMHQDMKARIDWLERDLNYLKPFSKLESKRLNRIDTCKRGLERIEQAYIKVLTEILAV
jgi:Lon protease-like protein